MADPIWNGDDDLRAEAEAESAKYRNGHAKPNGHADGPAHNGSTSDGFGARKETVQYQGRVFAREVDGVWRDDRGYVLRKQDLGYTIEEPPAVPAEPIDAVDMGLDLGPIPPRGWLLGRTFARCFLSGLIGQGGAAKTTLRIAQLLAVATGRHDMVGEHVHKRSRVLIVCLEDDVTEIRRRVRAACIKHNISQHELKGWFFVWNTKKHKFLELGIRGTATPGTLVDALRLLIRRHQIDIVCIDPFVKAHTINENDNSLIDEVANQFVDLSYEENFAPDYSHHVRKGSRQGGDAEAGRGASALPFTTRLLYSVTKMSAEEAELFGQTEHDRKFLIRVDDAKVNIAPPADRALWFKLISVNINNGTDDYEAGDEVQTVELWIPPDVFKDLTIAVANQILDAIDAGMPGKPEGRRYSGQARATERAAWPVVQEHCPTLTEGMAKRVIKTWLRNQVLTHEEYSDPKTRQKRQALTVGRRPGNTWQL